MTLCWIVCLTPAWREWSLDVRRSPSEWSPVAPLWSVYVFPALMGVVYFFGGIAKINYDWLIEAMPLHMWLKNRSEMPILGPLWEQLSTAYVMAWGGMLLDLTAAFLLLHKRLRWVALALLIGFHATNHLIFKIGIFPYLSMVLTGMFFAPDWPKRAVEWFAVGERFRWARARVQRWREGWQATVASRRKGVGVGSRQIFWQQDARYNVWIAAGLVLLFTVELGLPLRHHYFASDVNWTEVGHRYSWRMMLRSKQGYGSYTVVDLATGAKERVLTHR